VDLNALQENLRLADLDGWLFYDHHHRDPIAYRILDVPPALCSRRWYYLVPASGEPERLVHRIERGNLSGLPGRERIYSSWSEQREGLQALLAGKKKVAMQYSPLNTNPYIGLVDAGTVELVRSFGVEVVSSADLVQVFEARWPPRGLELHLEAGQAIHRILRQAFGMIRNAVAEGKPLDEYGLQQEILRLYAEQDLETEEPPIVAVNAHSGDPHYAPERQRSSPIRSGDLVLLDLWAKRRVPGAVYFDITWIAFVGKEVPSRYAEIFEVVRQARDAGVVFVQAAKRCGTPIFGYQVDDVVREVIARHGYSDNFVHRTGHSIGQQVHGNGANMDNFETHDDRAIISGTCFSIEPGIYVQDFGIRSEVDVYVEPLDARVTGEVQQAIVPIMA
jgi:Xaa-Pro dipeptidase